MKVNARIPVVLPSKGRHPLLCGVDVQTEIVEYDETTAPAVCRISSMGGPSRTYRITDAGFIAELPLADGLADDDVISAYLMQMLASRFRRGEDVSPIAASRAISRLYDQASPGMNRATVETVKALPSTRSVRSDAFDQDDVDEITTSMLGLAQKLKIVDGAWYRQAGEPCVVNNFDPDGVVTTIKEMAPLRMGRCPTTRLIRSQIYPLTEYGLAVEEACRQATVASRDFHDLAGPPEILLPDELGFEFAEKEAAWRLSTILLLAEEKFVGKGGRFKRAVPNDIRESIGQMRTAVEEVTDGMNPSERHVAALRQFVTIMEGYRGELPTAAFEWHELQLAIATIQRWDDRPIEVEALSSYEERSTGHGACK